jgi:hypothetical protein
VLDKPLMNIQTRMAAVEKKLLPIPQADSTLALLRFMRQAEVRAVLMEQGIGPHDPLKLQAAYQDALTGGDDLVMEAIEGWPLGHRLPPALVLKGQQERVAHRDPGVANTLTELQRYRDIVTNMLTTSIHELEAVAPSMKDDPIARQAAATPAETA